MYITKKATAAKEPVRIIDGQALARLFGYVDIGILGIDIIETIIT